MSYLRFNVDIVIQEPIPKELAEKLSAIQEAITTLKNFASVINEGKDNNEQTIKATCHRCLHDEGKPCINVVEIENLQSLIQK